MPQAIKECGIFFINPKNKKLAGPLKELDSRLKGRLLALIKSGVLSANPGSIRVWDVVGSAPYRKVVLVSAGKASLDYDGFRRLSGDVIRKLRSEKIKSCDWHWDPFFCGRLQDLGLAGQAFAEGVLLGAYTFSPYKSKPKKEVVPTFNRMVWVGLPAGKRKTFRKGITVGQASGKAVVIARDLANTPANLLMPQDFVDKIKLSFTKKPYFSVEIIDKNRAKKLGMQSFLGVAQGSAAAPYMAVVRYRPHPKAKTVALVGKGVTFDSGGISIKPAAKMWEMKADMSGAAAVFATMVALQELGPSATKVNVTAIIPLVENMCSGTAQRPGDVVRAMNGTSIEIINTDAEGRLILADALCLAVSEKADEIVDIATLTGACLIALGDVASAILSNNRRMVNRFKAVSDYTGERLWELPLYKEYRDYLKSDIADIKHCTETRLAGTATAAKFLEEFVDKTPWVHLDIASTMDASSAKGWLVKGMTGSNTRNLIGYVMGR